MDTYIIRIYRREESDPHTLTGTVEESGIPGKKAFVNLNQLWDILHPKKKKLSRAGWRRAWITGNLYCYVSSIFRFG